ncbi:hypothetical protein EDD11_009310 [Mortierella claussenii]|nr:hypothetical protein EDD11_009310 [Mortierella claussenii]
MTSPAVDLRVLHFRIPDHPPSEDPSQESRSPGSTIAKIGTHEWLCQLSILDDKSTLRGFLSPVAASDANRLEFRSCCSLQVTTARGCDPDPLQVLLSKRIKTEDLFKKGIEYGPNWTHTLALSECDPIARNVDPLVELMTQFERHAHTSDVECRFISKAGLVLDRMRAHYAVLSIYPIFSEKMMLAQRNPHHRATTTVLVAPIAIWAAFERMLGFIYSGRLPREGFAPRSEQWRIAFDLSKEYGLDKCASAALWMEWHLNELQQVITDENVLDVYFEWGYEHPILAQMCARYVAERSQVHFEDSDLGSHVIGLLKKRYQGRRGCYEFQEALVVLSIKMYAEQQQPDHREQRSSTGYGQGIQSIRRHRQGIEGSGGSVPLVVSAIINDTVVTLVSRSCVSPFTKIGIILAKSSAEHDTVAHVFKTSFGIEVIPAKGCSKFYTLIHATDQRSATMTATARVALLCRASRSSV